VRETKFTYNHFPF